MFLLSALLLTLFTFEVAAVSREEGFAHGLAQAQRMAPRNANGERQAVNLPFVFFYDEDHPDCPTGATRCIAEIANYENRVVSFFLNATMTGNGTLINYPTDIFANDRRGTCDTYIRAGTLGFEGVDLNPKSNQWTDLGNQEFLTEWLNATSDNQTVTINSCGAPSQDPRPPGPGMGPYPGCPQGDFTQKIVQMAVSGIGATSSIQITAVITTTDVLKDTEFVGQCNGSPVFTDVSTTTATTAETTTTTTTVPETTTTTTTTTVPETTTTTTTTTVPETTTTTTTTTVPETTTTTTVPETTTTTTVPETTTTTTTTTVPETTTTTTVPETTTTTTVPETTTTTTEAATTTTTTEAATTTTTEAATTSTTEAATTTVPPTTEFTTCPTVETTIPTACQAVRLGRCYPTALYPEVTEPCCEDLRCARFAANPECVGQEKESIWRCVADQEL